MYRSLLLAILLAGYASIFVRLPGAGPQGGFDPLSPRGRQVEEAIETDRFADALPVVLDLKRMYGDEPIVAYWLAETYRGLDRRRDEVEAWRAYIEVSSTPEQACPALAEALSQLGQHDNAIRELQQCVEREPDNPERLIDLAAAYARLQRSEEAFDAYTRAAELDPDDPRLPVYIRELTLAVGQ